MHFDTRLLICFINLTGYFCQYPDDQSYLSLIEFNRGGIFTNLILSSPHGGFLGGHITSKHQDMMPSNYMGTTVTTTTILPKLPVAGCYNDSLENCVYTIQDCLKSDGTKVTYRADARCVIDHSSTLSMYTLTKTIADAFSLNYRPYTILNKLTRQYVDPSEDIFLGTFLIESSVRLYYDYHRFIAMAKEAINPASPGLFIEFIFHKNSSTVQLGYGFDPFRLSNMGRPTQSTVYELISRSGPSVIKGNNSLAYFLRRFGFENVIPLEHSQQDRYRYRLSTYSTRIHSDQRFNAILFSYPIERLRTRSIKHEAIRIAKAIEQFIQTNKIKHNLSSMHTFSLKSILFLLLLLLVS